MNTYVSRLDRGDAVPTVANTEFAFPSEGAAEQGFVGISGPATGQRQAITARSCTARNMNSELYMSRKSLVAKEFWGIMAWFFPFTSLNIGTKKKI